MCIRDRLYIITKNLKLKIRGIVVVQTTGKPVARHYFATLFSIELPARGQLHLGESKGLLAAGRGLKIKLYRNKI